jgi:hypothetical protein
MATKLYLRSATSTVPNGPTGFPDAGTINWFVADTSLVKELSTTIGTGQTSKAGSSLGQTTQQYGGFGAWCSAPLDVDQTVGGGTVTVNIAVAESNTNMNLGENASSGRWEIRIYLYRPSSSSVVGNVVVINTSWNTTEPSAANTEKVIHGTCASNAQSALAGDVIAVELSVRHSQGMSNSYTGTIYYDGTTENTTTNTTVSNHASFVELTENITFSSAVDSSIDPMGAMGIFGI